jgi:YD repeat-containing protein
MIKLVKQKILLILWLLACTSSQSMAQSNDGLPGKVNIASPNAAALGKYGDIPVSNHTGIPQVAVPIYTVKEGPLQLPIGLSYHAGGLKVQELASWVGSGFSLNAGGVISRTVQHLCDEAETQAYGSNNNLKGHLSHGGYNSYVMTSDDQSPLMPKEEAIHPWIGSGRYDGEPDLFFFNFAGYSGKFFFNDDGQPVIVPQQDLKISYDYTPGFGQSISSFKVTTPDGTQYHFGKTASTTDVDPIEKTDLFGEEGYIGTNNIIASWYLNKVVSADNLFAITLQYVAEEYKYISLTSFQSESTAPISASDNKLLMNRVQGVRLTGIQFSAGMVNFDAGPVRQDLIDINSVNNFSSEVVNTQARALGAIRITDNSTSCKQFTFSYGYFESGTPLPPQYSSYNLATDSKRLRLDKVQEENCGGSVKVPGYQFDYFAEPVPRRLSLGQDHWGFVNGKNDNPRLTPSFTEEGHDGVLTEFAGADRDAAWPAMRGGTLKKITYPTGGNTVIDYEANTTWVNYNKYVRTLTANTVSVGYAGGTQTSNSITFTASGNPYTLRLINCNGGSAAYTNNSTEALPGKITEFNVKPAAGTSFTVSVVKSNFLTGCGAEVIVYEWVPTLVQTNMVIGGLRVKTLTQNDGTGTAGIVKNYTYNLSNGQSSGHLYSRPTYVQIVRNDFLKDAGKDRSCGLSFSTTYQNGCLVSVSSSASFPYLRSPNSIRPMETTQGNHVGYNEVKVSQTANGYSVYRYYGSNRWDNVTNDVATRYIKTAGGLCDLNIPNYPAAPVEHDFKRGELQYEGHFNEAGSLLKEATYYVTYTDNPKTTPALRMANAGVMVGLPTFYELRTAKKTYTKVEENVFSTNGSYLANKTELFFESPYHNMATRKVSVGTNGDVFETKYKYAADFQPAACMGLGDGWAAYQANMANANNAFNVAPTTACYNCGANNIADYCRYWKWQQLLQSRSVARQAYIAASKNYYSVTGSNSYQVCSDNAKTAADALLKPIYELNGRFQLVPVEVTNWRNGLLTGAAFTQYDFAGSGVYPIKASSINLASPTAVFSAAAISGNTLGIDSRYTAKAWFKYSNGNLTEIKEKDGVTTAYLWGHNNTLPIAKVTGTDVATLNSAWAAVGNNLTQLRTHPSLANALVSTYTYNPMVGITGQTDPNGQNIYYGYDGFGRLSTIKNSDGNIIKKFCYRYNGQPEDCGLYYNVLMTQGFVRNNCGAGYTGSTVGFTVAAGMFSSAISQADADAQALAHLNANGQTNANASGACTAINVCNNCTGINKKCINGVCELGIAVTTNCYYNTATAQYEHTYHYEFSDGSWSVDVTDYSSSPICFTQ